MPVKLVYTPTKKKKNQNKQQCKTKSCCNIQIDVVKGDHSGAGETREAPVYFQLALSRGQMGSNSAVSKHVLSGLFPFADGQFIWVYEISEFVYSERSNQAKRLGSSKLVW